MSVSHRSVQHVVCNIHVNDLKVIAMNRGRQRLSCSARSSVLIQHSKDGEHGYIGLTLHVMVEESLAWCFCCEG